MQGKVQGGIQPKVLRKQKVYNMGETEIISDNEASTRTNEISIHPRVRQSVRRIHRET